MVSGRFNPRTIGGPPHNARVRDGGCPVLARTIGIDDEYGRRGDDVKSPTKLTWTLHAVRERHLAQCSSVSPSHSATGERTIQTREGRGRGVGSTEILRRDVPGR